MINWSSLWPQSQKSPYRPNSTLLYTGNVVEVISQPYVINWVVWKCALRIPLTCPSLTSLSKHSRNTPANTHLWLESVGKQRKKRLFHEYWISLWGWKKQLCSGSFFNDLKVHTHESFSSVCLFDVVERKREIKKGRNCSLESFDEPPNEVQGWAPQSRSNTIFQTGGSSCCWHKKRPMGFISYLWKSVEGKQQFLGPE